MNRIYTDGSCLGNPGNGGLGVGKPVLSCDLWKIARKQYLIVKHLVSLKKVKAHSGDTFNDLADTLAKRGAEDSKHQTH